MKGILFDIGGVILPEEEAYIEALNLQRSALHECGIECTAEEYDAVVRRCIESFVPNLFKAITWNFTKPDIGLFQRVIQAYRSYSLPWERIEERIPRPGIGKLLDSLTSKYTLALAANAGDGIRRILDHNQLLGCFMSTLISGDLPYGKPDLRFFMDILAGCGLSPDEVIMIGDRLDNDIIPAKTLGMKTILYKTGPYSILEPRTPSEIPDAVVSSVKELAAAIEELAAEE